MRHANSVLFTWSLVLACLAALASPVPAQTADLSGQWSFHVTTDAGSGDPEFTLKQEGAKLTGKYRGQLGDADVTGKVEGNQVTIEFTISMGGGATIIYKGTVESPSRMKGTVDLAGQASGTWTAEKKQ